MTEPVVIRIPKGEFCGECPLWVPWSDSGVMRKCLRYYEILHKEGYFSETRKCPACLDRTPIRVEHEEE